MCYGYPAERSIYKFQIIDVLVDSKSEVIGFEGQKLTLSCNLKDEYNSVQWRKIKSVKNLFFFAFFIKFLASIKCVLIKTLTLNSFVEDGDLHIPNLKWSDAGEYECYANNLSSEKIKLVVKNPKEVFYEIRTSLNEEKIQAKLGDTVRQICTSMTNANGMRMYWYNQQKEKIKAYGRFSIKTIITSHNPLTHVSILTIKDFKVSDIGSYECRQLVAEQTESSEFEIVLDQSMFFNGKIF